MSMRLSVTRGHQSVPPGVVVIGPPHLLPLLPAPQPQPILIAKAEAPEDPDATLEYVIDNSDAPEVAANAVVLVDA